VSIKVSYQIDDGNTIRVLLCQVAAAQPKEGWNPLTDTPFNDLLDRIAENAFQAGRRYEKGQETTGDSANEV